MDITTARKIVADDVRQSYPEMTDQQAVDHAVNTVHPDEVNDDDPTAEAYLMVLGAAPQPAAGTPIDLDNGERNLIVFGLATLLKEFYRESAGVDPELTEQVYGTDFEAKTKALLHKVRGHA